MRAVLAAALTAGSVAFTMQDPRLTEASGIAVGLRSPGVVYLQNDSGDRNRFFAVNPRTGRTAATVTVAGARNVDWEDIAVAPDAAGVPSVWLADIGDNGAQRREIRVYRVAEPRLRADADDRRVTTAPADVWRLRYPAGPTDAESFAVAPDGTGYLVTKSVTGASVVYRLPARPDAGRVQTLSRVAAIRFEFTGTSGGPNPLGQLTATGAAFSPGGQFFVVRTYTDAYVWHVRRPFAQTFRQRPARLPLPAQPQGEGVAVAGGRMLLSSEGTRQPVYSVPLPPESAYPGRPATSAAAPSSTVPDEPDEGDRSGRDSARYLVGGAVVIALGLLVLVVVRRRR